ncbi:MAG: FHA domain-containing protein [Bacteroidetes bacterium]|nr:FHA domain-containing protein [Bacteroidota bacterium]
MTKTFGRADDNDVKYSERDISGHHARVTLIDSGNFLVEDLNSTNGTFVNGYRINRSTISLKDELRLSQYKIVNLIEIFGLKKDNTQQPKSDPKDYTQEFDTLKQVWDKYQKDRIAITKAHQKRTTLVRSGITLAPLIVWYVLQFIVSENSAASKVIKSNYIVFSVLGSTIAMLFTGNMSPIEELMQLDEEFRVKYVCPNNQCRTQLGNVPWQSYNNQGKCFRCGVKYSKQ